MGVKYVIILPATDLVAIAAHHNFFPISLSQKEDCLYSDWHHPQTDDIMQTSRSQVRSRTTLPAFLLMLSWCMSHGCGVYNKQVAERAPPTQASLFKLQLYCCRTSSSILAPLAMLSEQQWNQYWILFLHNKGRTNQQARLKVKDG